MVLVSTSILSANFLELKSEVHALERAHTDFIHIDVMDGHFVPNLTMGPFIIKSLKSITKLPLDVHLMINNTEQSLESYIETGADFITIHAESCTHLERAIKHIKKHGIKAGVALNPATSESVLQYIIHELDMVLIMSVNPGFSGQHFIQSSLKKINAVAAMARKADNLQCIISVDGGINASTASSVISAGATCLVSGSYIFSSSSYEKAIGLLKQS